MDVHDMNINKSLAPQRRKETEILISRNRNRKMFHGYNFFVVRFSV